VARVATTVFNSIASISEVAVISLGAMGLCLHEGSRTRGFSGKSIAIALKEESTQVKTTY
jgi:hypothetical protein